MSRQDSGLRCYRCFASAEASQDFCNECGLALKWNTIHELFALDYVRMLVDRWRKASWIDARAAERLTADTYERTRSLIDELGAGVSAPAPEESLPPPSPAPPAERYEPRPLPGPEPTPQRPAAYVPPPIESEPAVEPAPALSPRAFDPSRPPVDRPLPPRPPAPRPMPAAPRPPKRPILEVLLDPATLKLMLYAGAVLLAVGVLVYLRDALRVQLQRPIVQASLLGAATFGALAVGYELVRRARGRLEPRLVGRAFLFLGSLLLPVFFWFLTRSGLVEDRGNAWLVTLLSFAVSATIALTLGERAFVYMAYAGAMATGWLVTFRVLGGTAPGSFAVALIVISLLFLHAEALATRASKDRPWSTFGPALFLCGHVGVLVTLIFYTNLVRLLRPEVLAAFRHFDASGYSVWIGAAVALAGAEAYAFSAWRWFDNRFCFLAIACALWAVALGLLAGDARPEVWLLACGAAGFVCLVAAIAARRSTLWTRPFALFGQALVWSCFVISPLGALALAAGQPVSWHAAVGACLAFAGLLLVAREEDGAATGFALPVLASFALAWSLRATGVDWPWVDLALALVLAATPPLLTLLRDRPFVTRGVETGLAAVVLTLGLAVAGLGLDGGRDPLPALPATIAVAGALFSIGWFWRGAAPGRLTLYGLAVLAVQLCTVVIFRGAFYRDPIDDSLVVFWFVPLAYLYIGAWIGLGGRRDDRLVELARVARGGLWLATFVAAAAGLPLLAGSIFGQHEGLRWALAYALIAAPMLAFAMLHTGASSIAEGSAGLLLALVGYSGLIDALARAAAPNESLVAFAGLGLAPWLLAGAAAGSRDRASGIALPAGAGCVVAAAALAAVSVMLAVGEAVTSSGPADHGGHLALAGLVGTLGLVASAVRRSPLWPIQFVPALLATGWELTRATAPGDGGAIALLVAAGVALAFAVRARGDELGATRGGLLVVGHGWALLALATAIVSRPTAVPAAWRLVGLFGLYVLANIAAAALAERDGPLDWRHRDVAVVALFATASAALHALGRMTPGSQAEPLALLLTIGLGAVLLTESQWARTDIPVLTGLLMGALTLVALPHLVVLVDRRLGTMLPMGEPVWTPAALGRFAALTGAFFGVFGSLRRSPLGPALSAAALVVAVDAFCEAAGLSASVSVMALGAYAVGLHAVGRRAGAEGLEWLGGPARAAGHLVYALAAALGVLLTLAIVAGGVAGTANPRLTDPVAMFALLAGAAWAAGRLSGPPTAGAYRVASLVAIVLTYAVLGLRLGFHPWHDSAFYTLPAGAALVAVGVVAARRGSPGAAPMHWLGSVLAAAPMLLHALDDRFVHVRPSFGYDAATIGVALALGAVGILCQLKGPSVVGAVALGADLVVVAFSQIRWSEIPMAIYAIGIGSALFVSSWALIYRREQLERFREAFRGRRDAFERWR